MQLESTVRTYKSHLLMFDENVISKDYPRKASITLK